jgi:hypothetical protein
MSSIELDECMMESMQFQLQQFLLSTTVAEKSVFLLSGFF